MSVFDRLDRMTSRAVDRVNASAFTLKPMLRNPNGIPEPDPDRPVVAGKGVFDLLKSDIPMEFGNRDRRGNELRAQLLGQAPSLSVDVSYFATARPRHGDQVELAAGTFEVTNVEPDGQSRLVLRLVAMS